MAKLTLSLALLALALATTSAQLTSCPRPLPIRFTRFSSDKTTYNIGEVLNFTCLLGYRNIGESYATCTPQNWRVVGGRARAPQCVPFGPVQPTVPVGPGPNVAVSCNTGCDGPRTRCVIFRGQRICACRTGYFKYPTGCLPRADIVSLSAQACSRLSCPEFSTCGQYNNRIACFCNNGFFLYNSQCFPLPPVAALTCARPTGPNLVVLGPATKTTWNVGENIVFTCANGYDLGGERILRCTAAGVFGTVLPTCTRKDVVLPVTCSRPNSPVNGFSLPPAKITWGVNEVVTFQCNSGYNLVGTSSASCLASGQFTTHNPVCTAITQPPVVRVTCPSPPSPANGAVGQRVQWFEGDVAVYTCNVGYILSGAAQATCLSTGQFSSATPFCSAPVAAPRCTIPVVPIGGFIDGPDDRGRAENEVVQYTCRSGYRLIGNPTLRCMADGNYTSPFPNCINLSPPATTAPTTQAPLATCVNPPVPSNGRVRGGATVFVEGQEVRIDCFEGYVLTGPATFTCLADGTFSQVFQFCVAIDTAPPSVCARPVAPANGELLLQPNEINKNVWQPGERVLFNCMPGYNLVGLETLLCQVGGQYNGNVPICVREITVTCPNPVVPSFAFIVNNKAGRWVAGETIQFGCEIGFEPSRQPATILCQANGEYTAEPPTCVVDGIVDTTCTITRPQNGLVVGDRTSANPGEIVDYVCLGGYELVGKSRSICQFDGNLSEPAPVCQVRTTTQAPGTPCTNPEVPDNAMTVPEGQTVWPPGELITYKCNEGYEMVSIPTRLCQSDGTIFGAIPECRAITTPMTTTMVSMSGVCANPEVPPNAMLLPEGKTVWQGNELITYQCMEGYDFAANSSGLRFCQPDGIIFGDVPTCIKTASGPGEVLGPDKCMPAQPANGYIEPRGQTEFDVGVIFKFACDEGYEIRGMDTNMCVSTGMLAIDPATCVPSTP